MEDRWVEFERRLARAERQVRALRRTGLLVLITLGAILALRAAVTQGLGSTVREPFTVVDGRGKQLLRLDTEQAGPGEWVPRLQIFGSKGNGPVAKLSDNGWGGSLIISDRAFHSAGGLYASNAGGVVELADAAGRGSSWMSGWHDGGLYTGRVNIGYGRGMSAAVLAPVGDGALLVIRDTAGNEVARLGATGKGGILTLRNKARNDAARKELVTLSATAKGGRLTLCDPAGHADFQKP